MDTAPTLSCTTTSTASAAIMVASTFTADPLVGPLSLLLGEVGIDLPVQLAPYGQPFQQLLDPGSAFARNRDGVNVLLIRFEDWLRDADGAIQWSDEGQVKIRRNVDDLVSALGAMVARAPMPLLLGVCPVSPAVPADGREYLRVMQHQLHQALSGLASLHVLAVGDPCEGDADRTFDSEQDRLGHIPYTPLYFAALARAIARTAHALKVPPVKVLVLDCDNTLWKGVVGEDGPLGVQLGQRERDLQLFALEKKKAGMLLCLASKNNSADVTQVFETHPDMLLRQGDIVAAQVHWRSKVESLRALARDLNLGLDAFALVDDNPVECAEVRAACPEVLVLGLRDEEDPATFLANVWPLDVLGVTDEDRRRSDMVRQNLARARSAQSSTDMAAFIEGLELQIDVAPAGPGQLPRVSQLSHRTNQFNLAKRSRSEAELEHLARDGKEILVVEVRDRFGDYGLVGVVIFSLDGDALAVDTFLLSCRVLGRGVEHAMVRRLGEIAAERGKVRLEMPFVPSERNLPARRFLEGLAADECREVADGLRFLLSTARARELAYVPEQVSAEAEPSETEPAAAVVARPVAISRSARWNRVARDLDTPEKILVALQKSVRRRREVARPMEAPRTDLERRLSAIWSEVLGVSETGVTDDYYADLAGTSLQAVHLFARIERELGAQLPLVTLVDAPTIEKLAERIERPRTLSSVIALHTGGSGVPLFLVHDADGEIMLYRNLAQRLGDRPVYGIQPPGGQNQGVAHTRIRDMAAHYIAEIRALVPHGPYLLGGLCAGGVLAYEMALQLEEMGEPARLVAVFDAADVEAQRNPGLESQRRLGRVRQAWSEASGVGKVRAVAGKLRSYARYRARRSWDQMRLRAAVAGLRACQGLGIAPPALLSSLDVRSVYSVAESEYRPRRAVRDEIVLFRASEGEGSDQPYRRLYRDPLFGWERRSLQGARGFDVPGGHGSMLQEPHVAAIAEILRSYLASVLSSSGTGRPTGEAA